ncbi:WD repeat-containing protein 47 [Ditylenchus destructor]|nr:WD repeat-containing protein 47 [Ditylenchus destructor]
MAPVTASPNASMVGTVVVSINEQEILKAILEFLESRRLHISQLSLERETGVINGEFPEDLLFLRQLIIDGQWDSALEFVEPLKELPDFDSHSFRYFIAKYKYYELLCIKQEPGPMQDSNFAVEDIVECLKELEAVCSSSDEFRRLCALLTLPKLSDHEELKNWNPSSARMECFYKILPIVSDLLTGLGGMTKSVEEYHASNDRLVQLIAKGILYEACVDYCQSQALQGKNAPKAENKFVGILSKPKAKLSATDLSLISWLQVLENSQFTVPFEQKQLNLKLEHLRKPKLEAQWTEQILATPMKPGGQFPHSLVPHTKLKCAQKLLMSQSMILPCMFSSLNIGGPSDKSHRTSTKNLVGQPMSQSTVGFSISTKLFDDANTDVMKQSQLITSMLEQNSENAFSPQRPTSSSQPTRSCSPPFQSTSSGISLNSTAGSIGSGISAPVAAMSQSLHMIKPNNAGQDVRQELDAICRRNQALAPSSIRQGALPPVQEVITPTGEAKVFVPGQDITEPTERNNAMVNSRLFQEFSNRQNQRPLMAPGPAQVLPQAPTMYNNTMPNGAHNYYSSNPQEMFNSNMPMGTLPYQQPGPNMRRQNTPMHYPSVPNIPHHQMHYPAEYAPQMGGNTPRPTSMIMDPNQIQMPHQPPSRPHSFIEPSSFVSPNQIGYQYSAQNMGQNEQLPPRPDSITGQYPDLPSSCGPQNHGISTDATTKAIAGPTASLPLHFVPVCRYEDSQAIRAVGFHPSGKFFVIGTNSKQMLICRYPDIRRLGRDLHSSPPTPDVLLSRPKQHRGSVYCCSFNPTGELLATGSNDKTIRLMSFNAEDCKIGAEMELTMHDGTVRELIFMEESGGVGPHSSILVSGGAGNCNICLTDCVTGRTFKTFAGHTAPILGLYSWAPVTTFASCSQDKTIRFWDLRASNAVNVITPNPRTSNIIGGRAVQIFRPHGDEVRTVRCSNAAYYLLSGSYDKRVVITDMRGDLTAPLMYLPVAEHEDKVIQCRWHPRDFTFLSTSADRTAILWSLPTQPPC